MFWAKWLATEKYLVLMIWLQLHHFFLKKNKKWISLMSYFPFDYRCSFCYILLTLFYSNSFIYNTYSLKVLNYLLQQLIGTPFPGKISMILPKVWIQLFKGSLPHVHLVPMTIFTQAKIILQEWRYQKMSMMEPDFGYLLCPKQEMTYILKSKNIFFIL